jgi:hypothetical protein
VAPQVDGLSSSHWLVMGPTLFIIIGNLLSHFKHAYFTLAKTTESLRIDQALNSLRAN